METEEDAFNQVSIRLSVVESMEQLGYHDNSILAHDGPHAFLDLIDQLYSSQSQGAVDQSRVLFLLTEATSVIQVDVCKDLSNGSLQSSQV